MDTYLSVAEIIGRMDTTVLWWFSLPVTPAATENSSFFF
jgi:hypothetical protein